MVKCLSVDVESQGLDSFHGCLPYFLSTCDKEGNQVYWEVPVDPLTRQCRFSLGDRKEIKQHLLEYDVWIFQNLTCNREVSLLN